MLLPKASQPTKHAYDAPCTQVLGIIGALDPHTHKVNTASLSGEGKLEKEGVRPLRHGACGTPALAVTSTSPLWAGRLLQPQYKSSI